jgi:hypothetical protein
LLLSYSRPLLNKFVISTGAQRSGEISVLMLCHGNPLTKPVLGSHAAHLTVADGAKV